MIADAKIIIFSCRDFQITPPPPYITDRILHKIHCPNDYQNKPKEPMICLTATLPKLVYI